MRNVRRAFAAVVEAEPQPPGRYAVRGRQELVQPLHFLSLEQAIRKYVQAAASQSSSFVSNDSRRRASPP